MSFQPQPLRRFLLAVIAILLLSAAIPKPAQAYYWGYGGNWGSSLLGSLGYLAYPLVNRGPYSANPLFSTHSYIRRSAQRALTAPLFYRPYYLNNYKDDEPLYDPRSRYRPVRLQNLGQDQNVKANWKRPIINNSQQLPLGYTPTPNQTPSVLSDDYDPFAIRTAQPGQQSIIPASASTPYSPPQSVTLNQPSSIPLAPKISKKQTNILGKNTKANQISPIADGFISTINVEFGGNIKTALLDPATRSWAKALGLIDNDKVLKADFPQTRIHLIRQILMDTSLSSVSKLDAIKILLPKAGANRANSLGL